jgi:hypothetical protein
MTLGAFDAVELITIASTCSAGLCRRPAALDLQYRTNVE